MSDILDTDKIIRQTHKSIMSRFPKQTGYPDYSIIFNFYCENHIPKITQKNFEKYTTCSVDTFKRLHGGSAKNVDLKCLVRICIGLGLSYDNSINFLFIFGHVLTSSFDLFLVCKEALNKYCAVVVTPQNSIEIMNEVDQLFITNNCGSIYKCAPSKNKKGEL